MTQKLPMLPGALSLPAFATLACFAIQLLGGLLAVFVPPGWDGNWTEHIVRTQPHVVDRFFPFDAVWYQRIATDGYSWDPAQPSLKQDVAFFPLWPIVLRLIALLTTNPETARWAAIGTAACFAFASICAFHRLALKLLPKSAAATATWLFALYPGASFLLLSYPTGLMNLLCILALLAAMHRRYWAASTCAGLVTASGPLGLGTAMAVWVCAAIEKRPFGIVTTLARLGALGLLSISGLTGFLLWQFFKFGDAFAFIKAQAAWAAPLPWLARIPRAIEQLLILPDFGLGLAYLVHALHAKTRVAFQLELEKGLHNAALGLALLMCALCWRVTPRPIRYQGAFTLALFIWFHSTSRPGNSTLRLTYCIMTTFIGMAWLLRHKPKTARWVIGLSAAMLFCAAVLSATGYHVV